MSSIQYPLRSFANLILPLKLSEEGKRINRNLPSIVPVVGVDAGEEGIDGTGLIPLEDPAVAVALRKRL